MNRLAALLIGLAVLALVASPADATDNLEFFEARIRPVLVKHCYGCHSSASAQLQGGLRLDSREALLQGGESGIAVVPGKPEASPLLDALRHESLEMPPAGKLPDQVIDDFARWIRDGAFDPRDQSPSSTESARQLWKLQFEERSRWWSLQPPKKATPPSIGFAAWSREDVDRFVYDALDRAGLSPTSPADGLTLLRRLSLILTGLPPKPGQVTAFPRAFAHDPDRSLADLVDTLLASPHFGERFARHWMDVVRYTDTYGYEWDNPAKGSWEYRDYLIRAFNEDIGFDQLIREQLAGDLLPQPRINRAAGVNESLIGPMFYHLGEHRHGSSLDFNGIHQEMINNKVDAFSKAFLAMTVACARCHDHKLDAISQADYYALAGVFMSPRWTSRVIDAPGTHATEIAELKRLRTEIRTGLAELWRTEPADLANSLRTWATGNRELLAKATLDDVAHPLARLLEADDANIQQQWRTLSDTWLATRRNRIDANQKSFNVLTDFTEPGVPTGWTSEGDGITHGYVDDGAPRISLDGDTLVDELLPRGLHTHALSSKLPGAVRSAAQHAIPGRTTSLQLTGSEWSGYLTVPQNAFQAEAVKFLHPSGGSAGWISLVDSSLKNGVTRVFTEVATAALNPNFPPRTGLARASNVKLPDEDDGFSKRSWFSLTGIVTHDAGGAPQDTLAAFAPLYQPSPALAAAANIVTTESPGQPPQTLDEAWARVGIWMAGAVNRWSRQEATNADVEIVNWLLERRLLPNRSSEAPELAQLVTRYRNVESQIAFPRTVNSMDEQDVPPLNYRLNVRGNVDDDGPAIPRDFLAAFAGGHEIAASRASGRLELARYLSSAANPQTARVYVNRVWQWLFGQGIVATPNDFGQLGDRPSHPELLDWLALQFVADGWSTKRLVRRLVLSQTFRQSGSVVSAAADRDPDNRLLHHYPTRRLEAEAIRDTLLAVSGRLDPQFSGPPLNPPRAVNDAAKRLFSGPLDGDGRRSIYLKMSIMDPPKFLVCFNLPDLKLPTGRRDVTNVPAQALALLNDPLVVQLADHWAAHLVQDDCNDPAARVRTMFVRALGRSPDDVELLRWSQAVESFAQSEDVLHDQQAWAELAHAMFNMKEFIYYR